MCRNVEKYSKSHCSEKSVRRYFMKQEKVFIDTYEAKFTKSVCRWSKKCLSIFEKKSVRRPFTTQHLEKFREMEVRRRRFPIIKYRDFFASLNKISKWRKNCVCTNNGRLGLCEGRKSVEQYSMARCGWCSLVLQQWCAAVLLLFLHSLPSNWPGRSGGSSTV